MWRDVGEELFGQTARFIVASAQLVFKSLGIECFQEVFGLLSGFRVALAMLVWRNVCVDMMFYPNIYSNFTKTLSFSFLLCDA